MYPRKIALALLFATVTPLVAWASPIVNMPEDQAFSQNQGREQLLSMVITDDEENPVIKAGYFTLSLPEEVSVIFDREITAEEVRLSGEAVDNGKLAETPALEFLNKDKTVKVPVIADFDAGESFTISRLYLEGFNTSTTTSAPIAMQINGTGAEHLATNDIYVTASATQDNTKPETPQDIVLSAGTGTSVLITWTDPTDLDLKEVQILRGLNGAPPSGLAYASVIPGVEEFNDTDLQEGDTVTYILRAIDGVNTSENSVEYEWTVNTATVATETDSGTAEEVISEEEVPETTIEETTIQFTDTIPSWAESAVEVLAGSEIITGNPDGTFAPGNDLNRAEAAAMLWRVLMMGDPDGADSMPFTDVELGEWYTDYIWSLKDLSLVSGNPDGTYQPGESMNRAEFLQLAMNVYMYIHSSVELDDATMTTAYADLDTSAWYAQTVSNATAWGFVQGSSCDEGTCFNAGNTINRAEAAVILYNMFGETLAQ